MQSKRDGLIPIGEALAGMDGPVKAIREADPDLGFMARMLVLCSLPRTNPGNRLQYKRQNGPDHLRKGGEGQHGEATARRAGAAERYTITDTVIARSGRAACGFLGRGREGPHLGTDQGRTGRGKGQGQTAWAVPRVERRRQT